MAAFRFFDPVPQFRDALGNLCAGGSLTFTDSGTTTARNVFSDTGLSISLGNVLTLDSDARYSEDPYLSGAYRVVLKDSDGVTVWSRDNVQDVASGGLEIPDAADGNDGDVLKTDGTSGGFYWEASESIPSQAGNAGKFLTTDSAALSWATITIPAAADIPSGGISQASDYTQIGNMRTAYGSGTAPTAGAKRTSVAITFPYAFASNPKHLNVTPTVSQVTGEGAGVSWAYTGLSTTGCTVHFFAGAEELGSGDTNITTAVTFTYEVTGLMA
jgi:hypothetical protein